MTVFNEQIKNAKTILDNNGKKAVTMVINRGNLRNCLLDFSDFPRQAWAHPWWTPAWIPTAHTAPLYPQHLDSAIPTSQAALESRTLEFQIPRLANPKLTNSQSKIYPRTVRVFCFGLVVLVGRVWVLVVVFWCFLFLQLWTLNQTVWKRFNRITEKIFSYLISWPIRFTNCRYRALLNVSNPADRSSTNEFAKAKIFIISWGVVFSGK